MKTIEHTIPSSDHPNGKLRVLALIGLKSIGDISSLMGSSILLLAPISIIAFITLVGDRYVGPLRSLSPWYVVLVLSKIAGICLFVLAVIGSISGAIFMFSHGIKQSALYIDRSPRKGRSSHPSSSDPQGTITAPLGLLDLRIKRQVSDLKKQPPKRLQDLSDRE